ncbi:MAG TPA: proline racemase family protein [Candidatus Dormibacteraeota bacterium]|nr:proline racemase family protein [Candidatus Dormibacteraeota bacterium]
MGPIRTVDYHTAGEPFRIVVGGVAPLPGGSVLAQRRWAIEHADGVRRLLVNEPRGHADMYGCFVTRATHADLGAVFFHNEGFSTACGHGTIALVTWALESGRLPAPEGQAEVEVSVEAPSGVVRTRATVRDGDVTVVRFRNVPAFVVRRGVEAAGHTVDLAFGGAFYAIAPAPAPLDRDGLPRLIERGRAVRRALNAAGGVVHPLEPELRDVYGVVWTDGDRNVTVFADGEVDRSPCGSGTSARLALLDATGELRRGQPLRHRSLVGTEFVGRVVADADVAGLPAVVTEVEGSAHLTGRHEFILEPDDPLGTGFLLR